MSMKISNLRKFVLPPWANQGFLIHTTAPTSTHRYYLIECHTTFYVYEVRKGNVLLPVKYSFRHPHIALMLSGATDITDQFKDIRTPPGGDGYDQSEPMEGTSE